MLTQTACSAHLHRLRLSTCCAVAGLVAVVVLAVLAQVSGVGARYAGVEALVGPSVLVPIVPVHATRLRSGASRRASVRRTRRRLPG